MNALNQGLDIDRHARETLRLIGPDPDNWVVNRAGIEHNVAIIGGGQNGLAFSFALRRAGIGKVSVIDAAADAAQAGVWTTRARMKLLRTVKTLSGPEGPVTGLGFQAWYEARHGVDAFAALERIGRETWADYLRWFKDFLQIPIRYGTRLELIEARGDHFALHLAIQDKEGTERRVETARKVILAHGIASNGKPYIDPQLVSLPRSHLAHTADAIDFNALRGKHVAVVGAAASAFDAAAVALESGAASVRLFVRRPALPAIPVMRARGYPGAYDNFPTLPDAARWRLARHYRQAGSTPPADSVARVTRFANFHLHLGATWNSAVLEGGKVRADVGGEHFEFDFIIAGTGYATDLQARPELAQLTPHIALWSDRYQPPREEQDEALASSPYLGNALEYLEKTPGSAPCLRHLHVCNPAGFVSRGLPVGDVPSMKREIPTIVRRISEDLFFSDLEAHEQRMLAVPAVEFDGALYAQSVYRVAGQ